MRYSADHKAKTRAMVLTEAGKAIRKDGPHRVSVAAIMKRAGLTHGGFYAHFKSRDALLTAAITQLFEVSRERLVRAIVKGGLETYIDWYLSAAHRDAPEAGCAVAALASDLPRLSPACARAYSEGTRVLVTRVGEAVGGTAHATSIFAELVGALSLARIEADPKRSEQILAASRASVKRRLR